MNNFVISLKTSTERRKHINIEFSRKNVPFHYFDAISLSEDTENTIQELIPALANNKTLTDGEKGCLLSHLSLWKKCIDKKLDYITIFEDDVLLSDNTYNVIHDINTWLGYTNNSQKALIIKYETYSMPIKLDEYSEIVIQNRSIQKLQSHHWGTAAYLITNKMAAILLDFFCKVEANAILPIDQFLFEQFLSNKDYTIYQLNPAICIQEERQKGSNSKLISEIGERNQSQNSKKSIIHSISKEIQRIKRKIYYKTNNFKSVKYQ